MQKQSMKQQYKRDTILSDQENELLERLHNNDDTLKEIDLHGFEIYNDDTLTYVERWGKYRIFKKKLFKALETNTTVKKLIFSNEMHNHEQLAEVFRKNTTITHVDLSHCKIDMNGDDLYKLAQALTCNENTQITHLNLSYNEIKAENRKGIQKLGEALESNSSITHLYLNNNSYLGRWPRDEKLGIERFLNGLAQNSKITHLDLSRTYFGYFGDGLAHLFKNNSTIKEINLASTWMDEDRAILLFAGLAENKTIKSINLRGNYILRSEDAVAPLANVLKKNTTIMNLNLSGNRVSSKVSLKRFTQALSSNTGLKNLNLHSCECGDEGAIALADALKQNSTLTHLNLNSNEIGIRGAIALADALKQNSSLTHLNLGLNEFRELGIIFLSYALMTNTTIQELNLGKNIRFSEEMVKSLENFLKLNNIHSRVKNLNITYLGTDDPYDYVPKLEILKKFFLLVMIPRVLPENTDAFYLHLSNMPESTLKQNLAKRFFVLKKENQIAKLEKSKGNQTEKKILLPGKFSPLNKDKQVQTWNKGSIKKNSQLQATKIYDRIHPKEKDNTAVMLMMKSDSQATQIYNQIYNKKHKHFTFHLDPDKMETVREKEEKIWNKLNEYLLITGKQLTFDTDIPHKLFLEFLELYFDNGIIEFKRIFYHIGKEEVLQNFRLIVAIDYINVLHRLLPVDEIEKLIKNLFQEEQKQRTQKQRTQKQTSTSSTTSSTTQKQKTQKQRTQKQISKQISSSSTGQKKTPRPYYKKLEKKLFELDYEKIIDTIIQSNEKTIVNIQKQINQIAQLEKSKGNQTEKKITQKQDQIFDIKIRRKTISNIMINNKRMDKLKQIKNNEMDVIKPQSQTQQIQKKILDNMLPETFQLKFPTMLPETFPLKFPTIRKRKFPQNTKGQQQQNLKSKKSKTQQGPSNKKTKQKIIFQRVRQSTRGPVIEYTDPQTGNKTSHTISEEELQLKIEAGEYQQKK